MTPRISKEQYNELLKQGYRLIPNTGKKGGKIPTGWDIVDFDVGPDYLLVKKDPSLSPVVEKSKITPPSHPLPTPPAASKTGLSIPTAPYTINEPLLNDPADPWAIATRKGKRGPVADAKQSPYSRSVQAEIDRLYKEYNDVISSQAENPDVAEKAFNTFITKRDAFLQSLQPKSEYAPIEPIAGHVGLPAKKLPNKNTLSRSQDLNHPDFVSFDIETTGLEATDSTTAVAAIKYSWDGLRYVKVGKHVRYYFAKNAREYEEKGGTAVSHLTKKNIRELRRRQALNYGKYFDEKELNSLLEFIGDSKIVGHNISQFDLEHIFTRSATGTGLPEDLAAKFKGGVVDTLHLAEAFRGKGIRGVVENVNTLDTLFYETFHVTMEQAGLPHHNPESDAIATAMLITSWTSQNNRLGIASALSLQKGISTTFADDMIKGELTEIVKMINGKRVNMSDWSSPEWAKKGIMDYLGSQAIDKDWDELTAEDKNKALAGLLADGVIPSASELTMAQRGLGLTSGINGKVEIDAAAGLKETFDSFLEGLKETLKNTSWGGPQVGPAIDYEPINVSNRLSLVHELSKLSSGEDRFQFLKKMSAWKTGLRKYDHYRDLLSAIDTGEYHGAAHDVISQAGFARDAGYEKLLAFDMAKYRDREEYAYAMHEINSSSSSAEGKYYDWIALREGVKHNPATEWEDVALSDFGVEMPAVGSAGWFSDLHTAKAEEGTRAVVYRPGEYGYLKSLYNNPFSDESMWSARAKARREAWLANEPDMYDGFSLMSSAPDLSSPYSGISLLGWDKVNRKHGSAFKRQNEIVKTMLTAGRGILNVEVGDAVRERNREEWKKQYGAYRKARRKWFDEEGGLVRIAEAAAAGPIFHEDQDSLPRKREQIKTEKDATQMLKTFTMGLRMANGALQAFSSSSWFDVNKYRETAVSQSDAFVNEMQPLFVGPARYLYNPFKTTFHGFSLAMQSGWDRMLAERNRRIQVDARFQQAAGAMLAPITMAATAFNPLAGAVVAGVGGLGLGIYGVMKTKNQLEGEKANTLLLSQFEELRANLNVVSAGVQLFLAPLRMAAAGLKLLHGVSLRLSSTFLRFFAAGMNGLTNYGVPLTALTGQSYGRNQWASWADRGLRLSSGTSSNSYNNLATTAGNLMLMGQANTSQLIGSAMLGVFDDVYATDGKAEEHFANIVNKAYAMRKRNPYAASFWGGTIDSSIPQILEQMSLLGISDYRALQSGSAAGFKNARSAGAYRRQIDRANYEWGVFTGNVSNFKSILSSTIWNKWGKGIADWLMGGMNTAINALNGDSKSWQELAGWFKKGLDTVVSFVTGGDGKINLTSAKGTLVNWGKHIASELWPVFSKAIMWYNEVSWNFIEKLAGLVDPFIAKLLETLSLIKIDAHFDTKTKRLTGGIRMWAPDSSALTGAINKGDTATAVNSMLKYFKVTRFDGASQVEGTVDGMIRDGAKNQNVIWGKNTDTQTLFDQGMADKELTMVDGTKIKWSDLTKAQKSAILNLFKDKDFVAGINSELPAMQLLKLSNTLGGKWSYNLLETSLIDFIKDSRKISTEALQGSLDKIEVKFKINDQDAGSMYISKDENGQTQVDVAGMANTLYNAMSAEVARVRGGR